MKEQFTKFDCEKDKRPFWTEIQTEDDVTKEKKYITFWAPLGWHTHCNNMQMVGVVGLSFDYTVNKKLLTQQFTIKPSNSTKYPVAYAALKRTPSDMEIKNHFYVYNKEAEKIAKMEEKGISAAEVKQLHAALAKQKRKNGLNFG